MSSYHLLSKLGFAFKSRANALLSQEGSAIEDRARGGHPNASLQGLPLGDLRPRRIRGAAPPDSQGGVSVTTEVAQTTQPRTTLRPPRSRRARQRKHIQRCARSPEPNIRVCRGISRHAGVRPQLAADDRDILPPIRSLITYR